MTKTRVSSGIAGAALLGFVGCADPGVTESTRVPVCGTGGSVSTTPGTGAGTGGAIDMGGATGLAGTPGAGGAEQAACPSGYMCVDLSALGATAVDGAGNPITASCGMGAPSANCDDANPKSTCAGLTDPVCAHVSVAGMQIVSCGQRCTP